DQHQSRVRTSLCPRRELAQAGRRLLLNRPLPGEDEPVGLEDTNRFASSRKLSTNGARAGPESKQRWKPVQPVAESPPYENMTPTTHDTTKLTRARARIRNVMPDV